MSSVSESGGISSSSSSPGSAKKGLRIGGPLRTISAPALAAVHVGVSAPSSGLLRRATQPGMQAEEEPPGTPLDRQEAAAPPYSADGEVSMPVDESGPVPIPPPRAQPSGLHTSAVESPPVAPPSPSVSGPGNVQAAPAKSTMARLPRATSRQPATLEMEADGFLMGPSRRRDVLGLLPVLRPAPTKPRSDLERLHLLAHNRAWADVLQLTASILCDRQGAVSDQHQRRQQAHETRMQQETANIVALRLTALLKLSHYLELGQEVDRLHLLLLDSEPHDTEENAKESVALPNWAPLTLQIYAALTLLFAEPSSFPKRSCMDHLYTLRQRILSSKQQQQQQPSTNKSKLARIDIALSNAFMKEKDWRMALFSLQSVLDSLDCSDDGTVALFVDEFIQQQQSDKAAFTSYEEKNTTSECIAAIITSAARIELFSRQGRVLLQAGALPEAATIFGKALEELTVLNTSKERFLTNTNNNGAKIIQSLWANVLLVRQAPTQIPMNEGLLHFSHMKHDLAWDKFSEALDMLWEDEILSVAIASQVGDAADNDHVTSLFLQLESLSTSTLGVDVTDQTTFSLHSSSSSSLITACVNNLALCALHTCRMREAVDLLESLVREDPTRFLTESVTFNLCTLYELGADSATSERKNRILQTIAKRFTLHDIPDGSFRI